MIPSDNANVANAVGDVAEATEVITTMTDDRVGSRGHLQDVAVHPSEETIVDLRRGGKLIPIFQGHTVGGLQMAEQSGDHHLYDDPDPSHGRALGLHHGGAIASIGKLHHQDIAVLLVDR